MTASKHYEIHTDVHGEIGGVPFKYPKGPVTTKKEAEQRLLDGLVAHGIATEGKKS
jgi:hypothetical protein